MKAEKRKIVEAVLGPLKSAGWLRKGQSVYRLGDEVGMVVNVQASPYGGQHYVNVGFWFASEVAEGQLLKEEDCPVNRRLERIFGGHQELLTRALNVETAAPELLERVTTMVQAEVLPYLTTLARKEALAHAISSGTLGSGMVTVQAKRLLGL